MIVSRRDTLVEEKKRGRTMQKQINLSLSYYWYYLEMAIPGLSTVVL